MLILCEECGLQISDKAYTCPHCGLPLKDFPKNPPGKKSRKRLRLPNGFGRITKIKGRLRRPYRAMVTVGKDDNGRPIGKLLKPVAYFETYNEAYQALLEYNKNPYDLVYNPTVSEVYEKWYDQYKETRSQNRLKAIRQARKNIDIVQDIPFRQIRTRHIRITIDQSTNTMKRMVKGLWSMLFEYAVQYELTDRNYAKDYKYNLGQPDTPKPPAHKIYTKEEMVILWGHEDELICAMILVQCYTGMRPQELLDLKTENINLEEHYMIGGIKTAAGINRVIPIHPLIENIIARFTANGNDHAFAEMSYSWFRKQYLKMTVKYNLEEGHKLHDGRKHFITQAKKWHVDDFAIKRIVGHSIQNDLTESVYTERDPQWLYEEICKIEQY